MLQGWLLLLVFVFGVSGWSAAVTTAHIVLIKHASARNKRRILSIFVII
jgi:hypothetical protein